MEVNYILNGKEQCVDTSISPTVLKLLREQGLKGTKEGCNEGECGACSVLIGTLSDDETNVDYKTVPSCLLPIADLNGKHLVTIEGLSRKELSPVQKAFVDEGATQCGFCTPGFIISITAYLLSGFKDEEDVIDAIDGQICRCTGYNSIKKAVKRIDELVLAKTINYSERIKELISLNIIPEFFFNTREQLISINTKNSIQKKMEDSLKNLEERKIIAGGTDILVQNNGRLPDQDLVFLSSMKNLSGISIEENFISIKANTIIEDLKNSHEINKIFPGFERFLSLVSSKLIRNRGTIAGNIVNASPIGDISIILLALRTELIIMTDSGEKRSVNIDKFYKGYKDIDLRKNEIVYEIQIPVPEDGYKFNFEKVSQRKYLDIASCNTAILIKTENMIITDCSISAGGVYAYPLYLENLSKFLIGKKAEEETIEMAEEILNLSISPISDIRGSEKYKRLLLKNLLTAHMNIINSGK